MDDNPFEDLQPPSDEYMERQYGADRAKWKANGAVPPDDREPSDLPPEEANERPGHTGSDDASQAGNHAGAEWPHPIDFLGEPNSAPPELTCKHAPDALWDFCIDTSERMGVDPTSLLIGGLVSCAAVTSDAWRLQPKRYDYTWTESPRLWGCDPRRPRRSKVTDHRSMHRTDRPAGSRGAETPSKRDGSLQQGTC